MCPPPLTQVKPSPWWLSFVMNCLPSGFNLTSHWLMGMKMLLSPETHNHFLPACPDPSYLRKWKVISPQSLFTPSNIPGFPKPVSEPVPISVFPAIIMQMPHLPPGFLFLLLCLFICFSGSLNIWLNFMLQMKSSEDGRLSDFGTFISPPLCSEAFYNLYSLPPHSQPPTSPLCPVSSSPSCWSHCPLPWSPRHWQQVEDDIKSARSLRPTEGVVWLGVGFPLGQLNTELSQIQANVTLPPCNAHDHTCLCF